MFFSKFESATGAPWGLIDWDFEWELMGFFIWKSDFFGVCLLNNGGVPNLNGNFNGNVIKTIGFWGKHYVQRNHGDFSGVLRYTECI